MKPEIDRIKNDLDTIHKALGLAPGVGRDWVQWLKRDKWFHLWWCLPGCILIAEALLPFDHKALYGGLLPDQWAGLLVAAILLVMTMVQMRKATARDGRPEGLIQETKRVNGMTPQGFWFGVVLAAQAVVYFIWCRHYQIGFAPFWSGFFLLMGSSCLLAAVASRVWTLLGWAIPFLGYGICVPLVNTHGKVNGVLFGLMFIAVALSFSFITVLQIRSLERLHDAD